MLDLVQIERDPAESPPASGSVPAGTFSLPLAEQICTAVGHSESVWRIFLPPSARAMLSHRGVVFFFSV
ncbi:MAG: hypothetical protein ACON5D_05305 [Rubripirellula sp.]